jgi:hypothetical protein
MCSLGGGIDNLFDEQPRIRQTDPRIFDPIRSRSVVE